jgi:UDP-N-acetyl-D-glucosamine dehydrogenase
MMDTTSTSTAENLQQKFRSKSARVAVIGAGYVGLPFAVEAASAGFETVAYDVSKEKVRLVNEGNSYIGDVPNSVLQPLIKGGTLRASSDAAVLGWADAVIICVPTPLNKTKEPDVSLIQSAADALLPHLHRGHLVVLESTTYPGYTREVLAPFMERTGYRVGKDVFLAFSPERVDPGNPKFHTKNTPKVIGGMTPTCTELTRALYTHFIDNLVPVSSCDAAEMVKLLENTFRAVNIGLVNELALMCKRLRVDTWEVIESAATKPFGFMPFFPGPGLGGHCIPIDPLYLSWKLKTLKYQARFIELADVINSGMPEVAVQLVADALNEAQKPVKGSRILVLGVAYKANIDDVRESPALDVIELLHQRGGQIAYHDPHVPRIAVGSGSLDSVPLSDLSSYDAVVIVTNHSSVDYAEVCRQAKLVVDTRNATKRVRGDFPGKVVTL